MPGQSLVHEDIDSGADESAAGAGGSVPAGCPLTPPTSCPEPKLHYADVEPIFAERCVSCHDGMHGQWALTTYQPIADWFGEVQGQMISCTMPPVDSGLTMPTAERMKILTWIRCGFPK